MKNIAITICAVLSAMLMSSSSCSPSDMPETSAPVPPALPENGEKPAEEHADGATISGQVTTDNGTPVAGVAVSDGTVVTLTDEEGKYRLVSDKSNEIVFISLPGDYTAMTENNIPVISHTTVMPSDRHEIHDFVLRHADNSRYTVILQADQHLAARNEDLMQLNSGIIPDMNNFISLERDSGREVYSISLGDSGWEQFWVANSFGLKDAVECLGAIDCPTFHTIGNHDNNPYIPDDWGSSEIFRKNVAPSYYSFNIGKVHFVILDNIVYNNPGATSSTMGERTYDRALTDKQLAWLREDLAAVSDKSAPLVICGHVPFYADPRLSGQTATTERNMLNTEDLEEIIRPFSNVTLFSGHYHRNYTVASPYLDGVTEHNVASLSGSLWWTAKSGYSKNHICTDGSPGGYGILRVDNGKLNYSYKGAGFDESYQFRVYDLNSVRIDEDNVSGKTKYKDLVRDYADVYYYGSRSNEILVNVFSWQPGWNITIEEEDVILPVNRVRTKDPLHILSYECQRLSHNAVPSQTSTLLTQYSSHFFKARASGPDTKITVTVTDNSGRVFSETIERPKAFSISTE